jgi:hypothetical protein
MAHEIFSEAFLEEGTIDYETFKQRTSELLEEGKPTSGDAEEMPDLLDFTRLNLKRMERIPKQVELDHTLVEKLLMLPEKLYWVVLVEGWCGDVAQNLPIIAQMADSSDKVELRLIWRDEHPGIMDRYLTNGGRSIPKLIALRSSDMEEFGTWGPRPGPVQEEIMRVKEEYSDRPKKEMVEALHKRMHKWYAQDKGKTLQEEFVTLLEEWAQKLEESPSH